MPPPDVAGLSAGAWVRESGKALSVRASQNKEDKMSRIITAAGLQGRSLTELQALYQATQEELVRSERGSHARREALVSLEVISLAIAQRRIAGPGF